jgi:hypothetical protein
LFVRDVVVHTNQNIFPFPNKTLDANPAASDPFKLSDELWIGKIEAPTARTILELAEPPVKGLPIAAIQFAQFYSFVREKAGPGEPYKWDTDSRLQTCVALSRLVQPTSVSLRNSARIRYNSDSTVSDISMSDFRGVGIDTVLARTPQRDWLTEVEAIRLRELIRRFDSAPPPERASRALWYHEYATRTYYVEVRWNLVSTALEALVHVEKFESTRQFKSRVTQVARELGVTGFGLTEADSAYDLRSRLAHGQGVRGISDPERALYESMELILRLAVLRAIEDDKFAAILGNDEEIRKRWPLL